MRDDWVRFDRATEDLLIAAREDGTAQVEYRARGQSYVLNLEGMYQQNIRTKKTIAIRWSRKKVEVEEDPTLVVAPRSERLTNLVNYLLSPAVQVPLPRQVPDEEEKLTAEQVRKVFVSHVAGVERFLFREMPGQYSLNFLVSTYACGLRDYNRTPLGKHLLNLFRVIVHHGHDSPNNASASRHVQDLAIAFQDCQAVQARTIETIGLQVLGITADFRGLLERLIGDYKKMVLTMRTMEKVRLGEAASDRNPTHFENRLIADLGDMLGLDKDVVRLSSLDFHANQRHPPLVMPERELECSRCRQLFEIDSVLQAFVAEVNKFDAESPPESLPALFIKWVDSNMNPKHKHLIFDAETCSKVEVTKPLALAVLEKVFFGSPRVSSEDVLGDVRIAELFECPECDGMDLKPQAEADGKEACESGSRYIVLTLVIPLVIACGVALWRQMHQA